MLTKKQKEVLDYLNNYLKSSGYAPSLFEIQKHFKLKAVSNAHYYIEKLKKEGYLEKQSSQPRSISLTPEESVKKIISKTVEFFSVPVFGSANAGNATIFANQEIEGYVRVPRTLISRKENIFALRVDGDSMNKAKIGSNYIEPGDFVLIDSSYKNPKNGDYVLSIIDDCANLKKFEKDYKSGEIKLMPQSKNPKHKPIYISSRDNFMVNGKIIDVIKK